MSKIALFKKNTIKINFCIQLHGVGSEHWASVVPNDWMDDVGSCSTERTGYFQFTTVIILKKKEDFVTLAVNALSTRLLLMMLSHTRH